MHRMTKRARTKAALATTAVAGLVAFGAHPSAVAESVATDPDCELPGAVNVANGYDVDFCVAEDQLFIFAANYKPFEYGTDGQDDNRQSTAVWDEIVGEKLQAAFPDVDVKYATWDYPVRYEDLQAAGVVPDIVIDNPRNRIDRDLEPLGWVQDLTEKIEASDIDLGALNQAAVEQIRSRSDGGLYGVPLFVNDHVLYYNKKIFDKFGEKYPEAGSTYDDIYKKARKLTRQDGTDAYKGFMQHPDNYLEVNQLGLYPFTDAGSEEPAPGDVAVDITTPEWQSLVDNMYRFLTIERNNFTTTDDFVKGDMSRPGHVAMVVDTLEKLPLYQGNALFTEPDDAEDWAEWIKAVDVGVTSMPVLNQGDTTTYQPNQLAAFVTKQSGQQELAMDVVAWLTSEAGQVAFSSYAMKPVLENEATKAAFGSAIPELEGVDTSGVFWGENATVTGYENTEYWDIPMYKVFRQHVLIDGMTPEAALQVTEEEDIPAYIASKEGSGQDW